jgi:hypothetical protein
MTRRDDDKAGGTDSGSTHNAKVERRFTKELRAKTTPAGTVRADQMGRDYADNTGGNGHNDLIADPGN